VGVSAASTTPGAPINPPAAAAAGVTPSFGGLGNGKPVQTGVDPAALIAPDNRKNNLMEHSGSSSSSGSSGSSGAAAAENAGAYS
jgi:hypothetical protein